MISVITMWYNEEDLAPFFLDHYAYADKIYVLLDGDTNDRTPEILARYHNVQIVPFQFPDMMDDVIKINLIHELYRTIKEGWVVLVDSDEFIFNHENGSDIREELSPEYDCYRTSLYDVYRHISEHDLDTRRGTFYQRQHGVLNPLYVKPNIIKAGKVFTWTVGHHKIKENVVQAPKIFLGSHWAMVDEQIAIKRRIYGRKLRQSKNNLRNQLTVQHHHITEEQIKQECLEHLNDPLIY